MEIEESHVQEQEMDHERTTDHRKKKRVEQNGTVMWEHLSLPEGTLSHFSNRISELQ